MTYTDWYNKFCDYVESVGEDRIDILHRMYDEARMCEPSIDDEEDDLERNAKYRSEAMQPIVDELKKIRALLARQVIAIEQKLDEG